MVHGLEVVRRLNNQAVDSQPQRLKYSRQRPLQPGWYFCMNERDPDGPSEFICRIDRVLEYSKGMPAQSIFLAAWMTSAGHAGTLHESDWSDDIWWAGPIQLPLDS